MKTHSQGKENMAAETDRHILGIFLKGLLGLLYFLGLKSLGALSNLIGHLIVFAQRLETFCQYGRVVDKYVIPSLILGDKPESF